MSKDIRLDSASQRAIPRHTSRQRTPSHDADTNESRLADDVWGAIMNLPRYEEKIDAVVRQAMYLAKDHAKGIYNNGIRDFGVVRISSISQSGNVQEQLVFSLVAPYSGCCSLTRGAGNYTPFVFRYAAGEICIRSLKANANLPGWS